MGARTCARGLLPALVLFASCAETSGGAPRPQGPRATDDSTMKQAESSLAKAKLELIKNEMLPKLQAEKNNLAHEEAAARLKQLQETYDLKRRAAAADIRILEIRRDRSEVTVPIHVPGRHPLAAELARADSRPRIQGAEGTFQIGLGGDGLARQAVRHRPRERRIGRRHRYDPVRMSPLAFHPRHRPHRYGGPTHGPRRVRR